MSEATSNGPKARPSPRPVQKRRSVRIPPAEKKIGEDEFMAAAIGDVEWLRQSVRGNRGKINFDKNGLSPLHLAAIHGRLECLKLLLDKFKMDINLPSESGWRPVHLVISNQTGKRAFQCLCYLLEKGADPSLTNNDGITPMHQAASEGHVQCLKALIEVEAKMNGLDYRGHTPLDLAKLWGHRKCARILAAELWHQDKEHLAKEMNQLEKLHMQQVLKEIEADQEDMAHKQFYGDLAFKDWLSKRGLQPKPTGPPVKTIFDEEEDEPDVKPQASTKPQMQARKGEPTIRKPPKKDTVQKANSVQKPTKPAAKPQLEVTKPSAPPQKPTPAAPTTRPADTFPARQPPTDTKQPPEDEPPTDAPAGLLHPKDWNKSTKVVDKDYVPILQDHYPHDEYTMMPKHTPKRLVRSPTTLDDLTSEAGSRRPRSSSETPPRREVVYKCKHISDIHKKKHYDEDLLPRPELGMHLANDPNSRLFTKGLLATTVRPTTESRAGSAANMDLPSIMRLMERMSKPTQFPPIKGAQYDLHREQKAF